MMPPRSYRFRDAATLIGNIAEQLCDDGAVSREVDSDEVKRQMSLVAGISAARSHS